MKKTVYIVVTMFIVFVSCISLRAEEDAVGALRTHERAPETAATGVETNDVASLGLEQVDESEAVMTPPSLRDLAISIKQMQSGVKNEVYQFALEQLGFKDEKALIALYSEFREKDKEVIKNGQNREGKKVFDEMNSSSFKKKYDGGSTSQGTHFFCIHPKSGYSVNSETKKIDKVDAETAYNAGAIISGADAAFEEAAQNVLMEKFMLWRGRARGKIYIIPDDDMWNKIRKGRPESSPVEIVLYDRDTREFFILVTPYTRSEAQKAIAYAVAQCALEEYAMVKGKERTPELPLVVLAGMAGNIARLDSIITEKGPRQLDTFQNRKITGKEIMYLRKKQNDEMFQLPLSARTLIKVDSLVRAKSYPKKTEELYYYLRQSKALTSYMKENGAIPFLLMVNTMIKGTDFQRAFEKVYVEVRNEIRDEGVAKKDVKKPKSREELEEMKEAIEASEDTLAGYKELKRNADDVIFYPLTMEAMKEEKMEERNDTKSSDK